MPPAGLDRQKRGCDLQMQADHGSQSGQPVRKIISARKPINARTGESHLSPDKQGIGSRT